MSKEIGKLMQSILITTDALKEAAGMLGAELKNQDLAQLSRELDQEERKVHHAIDELIIKLTED